MKTNGKCQIKEIVMKTNQNKKHFLDNGILFFIACLLLSIATEPLLAEEPPNIQGYIVTRDGRTIHFTGINRSYRLINFRYGPENKKSSISLANVAEIIFGENSRSARIKLKDRRTIDAKCKDSSGNVSLWAAVSHPDRAGIFYYYYFDDVTRKQQETKMYYNNMARIVVGEHVGRFRRCLHCKGLWPDSYLYCPHDGTQTVWGAASGSLKVDTTVTREQLIKRKASIMEAILNASLTRSGIDPSSEEAERAKRFGKLWINPAANPEDIHKQLDELRDSIIKKESK